MQDAFVSETGYAIGSWLTVGYQVPGTVSTAGALAGGTVSATTNFEFAEGGQFDAVKGTAEIGGTATETWTAKNLGKLNSCTSGVNWGLQITLDEAKGAIWKTKALTNDCQPLTPQFSNLGSATYSGSGS